MSEIKMGGARLGGMRQGAAKPDFPRKISEGFAAGGDSFYYKGGGNHFTLGGAGSPPAANIVNVTAPTGASSLFGFDGTSGGAKLLHSQASAEWLQNVTSFTSLAFVNVAAAVLGLTIFNTRSGFSGIAHLLNPAFGSEHLCQFSAGGVFYSKVAPIAKTIAAGGTTIFSGVSYEETTGKVNIYEDNALISEQTTGATDPLDASAIDPQAPLAANTRAFSGGHFFFSGAAMTPPQVIGYFNKYRHLYGI